MRGSGALFANSAHLLEPPVIQSMGAASRSGRPQSSAWYRLARERGNLRLAKDELIRINRGRLRQCVGDQMTEFNDRKKARENRGNCYQSGRYRPAKRSRGCRCQDSSARAPEGGGFNRGRSPDDSDDTKDSKYRSSQKAKEERRKRKLPRDPL